MFLATVDPGDRVMMPDPTYSLYPDAVQLAGGHPVLVPTRPDRHLDPARWRRTGRRPDGGRLQPGQPDRRGLRPGRAGRLGQRLAGTGTLVMADEAYGDFVYDGRPFTSALTLPSLRPRLICVQTLSKTYAMTGWRIGYAVAPPDTRR